MAQNTTPTAGPERPEDTSSQFHYYSGGEVKELSNTNVSPLLWVFWTVVILGAVGYLIFGGALGPKFGGFRPVGGTQETRMAVQETLNNRALNSGETAQQADMMQIVPFLQANTPGETLDQGVANGQDNYQHYCIGCHGPNQDGNGPNASSLNPKPRNLNDAPFMRETMDYHRINQSLHYGVHGTAMPPWGSTMSEAEIQDTISYVLSLTWTMPSATGQQNPVIVHPSGVAVNKASSGGSSVHGGSVSTSPKPITPAINGNPAAATSTSPPSQSGSTLPPATPGANSSTSPATDTPGMTTPPAGGSPAPVAPGTVKPTPPDTGGASVTPPFNPGHPAGQ